MGSRSGALTALAPFGDARLLIDMSAYARSGHPSVEPEWEAAVRRGQLIVCPLFFVEALYSARDTDDVRDLAAELGSLPFLPLSERTHEIVADAFRELATRQSSYHRVPPPDALIAALAHEAGVGVLHYDAHYDRLAEVLDFESRWIASPGSLD